MSLLSYRLSRFVRQTLYATGKASGMIQLLFYFCQPTLLNHIDYYYFPVAMHGHVASINIDFCPICCTMCCYFFGLYNFLTMVTMLNCL
uniref:Uncharacterized protein n=2 Tax=Aegilops tauschii subsp. strangulata TaxID=200361 RepID=A0A453R530_AEGTS